MMLPNHHRSESESSSFSFSGTGKLTPPVLGVARPLVEKNHSHQLNGYLIVRAATDQCYKAVFINEKFNVIK